MGDTTNRLAGIASIAVNGQSYMMSGEFEYSVVSVVRKTLKGQDRVHGYSEEPDSPYISGTFRDAGGLSVADFNAMTNVTVTLELANGKVITGRNMWTVEGQAVKTAEGTFDCRFETFDGGVTEKTK